MAAQANPDSEGFLMTSTSDWNNTTSVTAVAYFDSDADAQNAINELVDEGFPVNQIGAVFHSRGGAAAVASEAETAGSPNRSRHEEMTRVGSTASAAGTSGAESDTSGVTPAGLSTGAGTGFTGAPRPGPIPGSEIPSSVPSELPSGLESSDKPHAYGQTQPDLDASYEGSGLTASPSSTEYDREPEGSSERPGSDESWWDKLKHLFSGDTSKKREPRSDKDAANYGTGEGQLGVASEYDYPYSGSAFESSFCSMGIPETRARRLAGVIRRGGAIVTVIAESRQAEAERILERNHGRIKEESESLAQHEGWGTGSEPTRVQVFGRVQRVYPGYISAEPGRISSDPPARKAS
jgi:hypothetical protein